MEERSSLSQDDTENRFAIPTSETDGKYINTQAMNSEDVDS